MAGRFTTLPTRKLSETILDFGAPMLAPLGEVPPEEDLRRALELVIAIWNAHVFALAGNPTHLSAMADLIYAQEMSEAMDMFEALSARRVDHFSTDPRLVGDWDIVDDGRGGHAFQCEVRVHGSFLGSA